MKKFFFLTALFFLLQAFLPLSGQEGMTEKEKLKRAKAWEGVRRLGKQGSGILSLLDAASNHKGTLFSGGRLTEKPLKKDVLLPSSVNVFLIHAKKKLFLVDTGFGGKKGALAARLALLDVKKEKIYGILLTHVHPDHIGGLLKEDGKKAAFPKAQLYISRKEYNWNIRRYAPLYSVFARIRQAYHGRIRVLEAGENIEGLFTVLDAAGHTPGHTVYQYKDILFTGDLLHAASLQFEDPAICAAYDMDKKEAEAARRKFFELAARKALKIAGAHIPFPGFGTLHKEGKSYSFTPAE